MFGDLPSLFGKNFAVGYLIPAAAGFALGFKLVDYLDASKAIFQFTSDEPVVDLSISVVLVWLLGVTLMAVNRILYRILEGYGRWNPLQFIEFFSKRQRAKFVKLRKEIDALTSEITKLAGVLENANASNEEDQTNLGAAAVERVRMGIELLKKQYVIATDYPDKEAYILPTKFGNRIRAFEVYSRVVYGLDSIGGWERIMAFLPAENREAVGESKAIVDLWVNLVAMSAVLSVVCVAYSVAFANASAVALVILFVLLAWGCLALANLVVPQWGEQVKSIFDVHRASLAANLGFTIPQTAVQERKLWLELTKVFQLRSSKALDRIDSYRLDEPAGE